jgi:DNA-binding transcriptional regulator PaaX
MTITLHNDYIRLAGETFTTGYLTVIQAQNILLKLGFDKDALFEALWSMEEQGWLTGYFGICGGFMYGE